MVNGGANYQSPPPTAASRGLDPRASHHTHQPQRPLTATRGSSPRVAPSVWQATVPYRTSSGATSAPRWPITIPATRCAAAAASASDLPASRAAR